MQHYPSLQRGIDQADGNSIKLQAQMTRPLAHGGWAKDSSIESEAVLPSEEASNMFMRITAPTSGPSN